MDERWQYQLITLASDRDALQVQDTLNAVGNDGWELVAIYPSSAAYNIFVFQKRTMAP